MLARGQTEFKPVEKGAAVGAGDQIHTLKGSKVLLAFDDGSKVELGPNSSFTLDESAAEGNSMRLSLGGLKAFITHMAGRRFEVHTPTAVCAVRGTEFSVDVSAKGNTNIQMFSGILAVGDHRGNETMLRDRESLNVTDAGLGPVQNRRDGSGTSTQSKLKALAKKEVGLEMSKEAVQAAAAAEVMGAVYKEGKAIIDVNGQRVRIEQYIIRPTPNSFKLVVLDTRASRFDYFYYHGVFNTNLPDDLSEALRQLPGCIGAACSFFLTSYDTGRSNTRDNMLEVAAGGHQVDVNNDGVANDEVLAAFDAKSNNFVGLNVPNKGGVGNQSFFQTLYNFNTLTFNGVPHNGWSALGAGNITNMGATQISTTKVRLNPFDAATLVTPTTLTTVQNPPGCAPPNCTFTEAGLIHQVIYSSNANGQWDKFDSYIISDEGKVATVGDFSGITSGGAYKQTLLRWNFEQIVTASEFNGRTIDLAVSPKLFIQSGLIP